MGATILGIGSAIGFASGSTASSAESDSETVNLLTAVDFLQNDDDEPANICLQQNNPNLLQNPSFEGQYSSYVPDPPIDDCPAGVCTTAQIPEAWTPYWKSHNPADEVWIIKQPEYKPACESQTPCRYPNRLRDGGEALQYFSFHSSHEAGVMQTVPVVEGMTYCLSSWGHAWSTNLQQSVSGKEMGEHGFLRQKIGIDPTGGTDWTSPNIVWSDQGEHPYGRMQYDFYGLFTISAQAQSDEITVFMYSQPEYAAENNDVYWDDALLSQAAYTTTITTTGHLLALTDITNTVQLTQEIEFALESIGPLANYTWTASITDPLGVTDTLPLTPTFNQSSGGLTETLDISVDTTGLLTGSYAADVLITTDPVTGDTPIRIPIRVYIVEEVSRVYLPTTIR